MKTVNDLAEIVAIEYNRLLVRFKDGTTIETTGVEFLQTGELEFGYIFSK